MDGRDEMDEVSETSQLMRQKRIVHGARFRTLPLNVKCAGRCRFCYEARVPRLLPHVRTEYIPRYDVMDEGGADRFDEFRQMYARALQWEAETGREPLYAILPTFDRAPDGQICHFPICDIFSAGLSHEQIEELVKMREGDMCLLYAVGLDLDPDFIVYLTGKYPDTFRLHLSIVTFDEAIRGDLMNRRIDVDLLRRVCSLTREANFFFMLFNEEQLLADLEELYSFTSPRNGGVFVHKLYHDDCSPPRVVEYAQEAERRREAAVRALTALRTDGRSLLFSLGGDIQAYTRRFEIQALLSGTTGSPDEAIFCSRGAFDVIDAWCARLENVVVPMPSALGGNIDFAQGATARSVITLLEEILSARELRKVFLPAPMFWIDDGYDLNGDRVETIAEAFPELSIEVLSVPTAVLWSAVDLADCLAFFDR